MATVPTPTPTVFNYNIAPGTIIGESVTNAPNALFSGSFSLSVSYNSSGAISAISVVDPNLKTDAAGVGLDSKFDANFNNSSSISSYTAINSSSDHNGVSISVDKASNVISLTFDAPANYTDNSSDYNRITFSFADPSVFTGTASDNVSHSINVTNLTQQYWSQDGCDTSVMTPFATKEDFVLNETIPCYVQGTLIATANGLVAVEDLQLGDQVLTVHGKAEPVIWLGHHTINCHRQVKADKAYPVCIEKDALDENVPSRNLYVSPDHSIYVDGVMIPAFALVNGLTIQQPRTEKFVTYYHVELPSHQAIYAEGVAAESYLDTSSDNRNFFKASTERSNVHAIAAQYPPCPEGVEAWRHIWDTQGYAKLVMSGPVLESVKMRLQRRAEQLLNLFRIAA
jgi:hypothetical protein